MYKKVLKSVAVAAALSTVLCLQAAETVHLYLKGSKTVSFNPATKSGAFLAQTSLNAIKSPRDVASGLPTGRRTHEPITIRKRIDKSTPLLMQALVTNEVIKSATFSFFRPAGNGQVEVYGVAKLTDVRIKNIRKIPGKNAQEPQMEEISFVFHNITWEAVSKQVPRRTFIDEWTWE